MICIVIGKLIVWYQAKIKQLFLWLIPEYGYIYMCTDLVSLSNLILFCVSCNVKINFNEYCTVAHEILESVVKPLKIYNFENFTNHNMEIVSRPA